METNLLWVPHQDLAFVPAQVLQSGPSSYKVKPLPGQGGDFTLNLAYNDPPITTYFPVHETSLTSQDNLLNLSQIVEPAMLHQLRLRFDDDVIYTWISSILVSVNPFKSIKDLYTVDKMHETMQKAKNYETKMPAHLFSTAAQAYQQLCTSNGKTSISVIISGESGSGKTLCNNLFLQFFSVMSDKSGSQPQQPQQPTSPSSPLSPITDANNTHSFQTISQKIISSAVILEAFGNSKTVRNNNSSRFGKYIRLYFTHGAQQLAGASIESYLLEKSRITTSIHGERNYHVFYQLISGLSSQLKTKYSLNGTTDQFAILRGSDINLLDQNNNPNKKKGEKDSMLDITGFDDKNDFMKTCEALSYHFDDVTLNNVWRVLAGVLHLGNVQFEEAKGTTNDGCKLTDDSDDTINIVCDLLGLDKTILEQSLLSQKLQVGKDLVLKKKNLVDARGNLQSLMRTIFDTQFTWLIQEINKTLSPPVVQGVNAINNLSSIGILDIFGFEDFQVNSYEQLLINYTNEKLQSFFNQCVFEIELAEYRLEALDIDIKSITYTNNQPCLDLIETGAGCILEMIDDELKLPKGQDLTFLEKLDKRHEFHPYYTKTRTKAPVFTISHYAAKVVYNVEGWLVKSKDDLQLDLAHCFTLSTIPHLRGVMTDFFNSRKGPQRSLGFKFRNQLGDLVKMLFDSSPYFVRCIKSNHQLAGGVFDSNLVLSQMKYLGLMSLVKIREVGYPLRMEYKDFLLRYNLLQLDNANTVPAGQLSTLPTPKQQEIATSILKRTDPSGKHWKLGKTKVFYRNAIQSNLERMRADEMEQRLMYLQSYIKTLLVQRTYNAMIKVINSIDALLVSYAAKLNKQLLHEISPSIILPEIAKLVPLAQQHQLEFDPTSHKRGNIVFTLLLQLQQRLSEQEDAMSFLQRALLANNKDMLMGAMKETQGAYLTPYTQDRDENNLKPPQDVDLDLFATEVATLLQNAIQLHSELDAFDQLRVKTESDRTLDLALTLIKTAQRLGVDKSTFTEIELLYKDIADEVARKEQERKKREEEEKKKKEEEERLRVEEEKRKVEAEKKARDEEKKKIEEEQRILAAQNKQLAEEEKQRLIAIEAAEAAQSQRELETEELAKEVERKRLAEEKRKEEAFKARADPSTLSPKLKPGTPKLQPSRLLQLPSSLNAQKSVGVSNSPSDKRLKPDYNKICHLIGTSNPDQLDQYLLQFQSISPSFDHLIMEVPTSPCVSDRPYLLNLNTPLEKPYLETLPLFDAVLRGDPATIDVLINHSANVNALNKAGQTPLWVAIREGKYESALLLIDEHGAAISKYDMDEGTGNCIGHALAQSLATLLSKFSTPKAQFYVPLVEAFLRMNDTVIYNVENGSKHTPIQYFKKIIKSGQQQLHAQIQAINTKATTPNAISQHGVKTKNKDTERDLHKCQETLAFLDSVKRVLFELQA